MTDNRRGFVLDNCMGLDSNYIARGGVGERDRTRSNWSLCVFSRVRGLTIAIVLVVATLLVAVPGSATWAGQLSDQGAEAAASAWTADDAADPGDSLPSSDGESPSEDQGDSTDDAQSDAPDNSVANSEDPASVPLVAQPVEPSASDEDLPAPPPKADAPSAATETDASQIARDFDHNVVVDSQTTETSLVEALPDGTYQLTSSSIPVRVEQDGAWVDIDTTLGSAVDGGGRHRNSGLRPRQCASRSIVQTCLQGATPVNLEPIRATLSELVDLLALCGLDAPSNWFSERLDRLQAPTQSDEALVLAEIHKAIPGMGGLADIWLDPPASSGLSREIANTRKHRLQERLYELTA